MMWRALAAVAACIVIAGCGGGSPSSPGGGLGEDHSTLVGIASISYQGKFVPAGSAVFEGVTITTMAGATFSNVTLTPAPKLENSTLVFANLGQVLTYQPGRTISQITNQAEFFAVPTVSKNGQVFFIGESALSGTEQIFGCNLDGSNLHQVTSTAVNHDTVSVSPSGTKLAFSTGSGRIYTVNADGTAETQLSITGPNLNPNALSDPAWSPDGTKLAFEGADTVLNRTEIYSVAPTGGVATEITNLSSVCMQPHWSPNGSVIAFVVDTGSTTEVSVMDIRNRNSVYSIANAPSGTDYQQPCFTPDGNSVAYVVNSASERTIRTQLLSDPSSIFSVINSYPSSSSPMPMCWSPYFAPKAFVGTGGLMTSAAGFIWGQKGDGFGGFAAISATTPASLTITQQPAGAVSGPVVYLARADKITKIVYSNVYFGAYNAVTPANSTQALISVSSETGQVNTIALLAAPGLTPSTRGGFGYDGNFAAIYDSHGRNLAPVGASHVQLDPKTGMVINWQ
ncbi:MAG TPA: hypothetical protein VG944_10370 [Fimbriimonas sp.]|nr:hypothetical protein [Fimbriimonas sp.]